MADQDNILTKQIIMPLLPTEVKMKPGADEEGGDAASGGNVQHPTIQRPTFTYPWSGMERSRMQLNAKSLDNFEYGVESRRAVS